MTAGPNLRTMSTRSRVPRLEETRAGADMVSRRTVEGRAIAADPLTSAGRHAGWTADTACVPFVGLVSSLATAAR